MLAVELIEQRQDVERIALFERLPRELESGVGVVNGELLGQSHLQLPFAFAKVVRLAAFGKSWFRDREKLERCFAVVLRDPVDRVESQF